MRPNLIELLGGGGWSGVIGEFGFIDSAFASEGSASLRGPSDSR
jgi:hypothetical protein